MSLYYLLVATDTVTVAGKGKAEKFSLALDKIT